MYTHKPILTAKDVLTYESFRHDWGTLGNIAEEYLSEDHDFRKMHEEFNLLLDIEEDYLLEDLMTFAFCAAHYRLGWQDDDYIWNSIRAQGAARYGFEDLSQVFQDFIDFVETTAGDKETYPDLSWDVIKDAAELQEKLTEFQARLAAAAAHVSRDDLAKCAVATYAVEFRPFEDAITGWRELVLATEKYVQKADEEKAQLRQEGAAQTARTRCLSDAGVTWYVDLFQFQHPKDGEFHVLYESNKGPIFAKFDLGNTKAIPFFDWMTGDVVCSPTDQSFDAEGQNARSKDESALRSAMPSWIQRLIGKRKRDD